MTGVYRMIVNATVHPSLASRLLGAGLLATLVIGGAAPARAEGPGTGEVTAVSLAPAAGKAELVIAVKGAVDVRDFLLTSPDRLVLDVVGAKLSDAAPAAYDGMVRGGVLNLRYSQFRPDIVRIVVELDGPKAYEVKRQGASIKVSFGADQKFKAWKSTEAHAKLVAEDEAPAKTPGVRSSLARATMVGRGMEEPRITVTWDRASIADVVAGFAAFSGRTIIIGKDVKGEVTAEVKNQPWPMAFQAILGSQGLSAQEMAGGIIRVDAPGVLSALDSLEPLETSVVRINYAHAGSLEKTVESILTKGRGRVVADTGSNSLIITDTRTRVQNVTEFVRGLDIRTPQLSIQAKIIFVDRTDVEELGIKYDLGDRNQFFNKLVQRTDPTTGSPFDRNINVINLGGNSVSAIGNADATHHRLGARPDLLHQHRWLQPDHVPQRAGDLAARRHPGRAGHHDAGQPAGGHPGGSGDAGPSHRRLLRFLQRRPRERAVQGDRYPAHRHAARDQRSPDSHDPAYRALRASAAGRGRPGLRVRQAEGGQPAAGGRRRDRGHRRPHGHRGREEPERHPAAVGSPDRRQALQLQRRPGESA